MNCLLQSYPVSRKQLPEAAAGALVSRRGRRGARFGQPAGALHTEMGLHPGQSKERPGRVNNGGWQDTALCNRDQLFPVSGGI